MKKLYKNKKFKISTPSLNEEFQLLDGSYSDHIENRITVEIKTGYYFKLLSPDTMKLLGSTKSKITKDKNEENLFRLEITEVVLVHCNIVNKNYQQT